MPDGTQKEHLGVQGTPYAWASYRATASFRKAKSSFSSDVESSVSQTKPPEIWAFDSCAAFYKNLTLSKTQAAAAGG